MKQSLSLPDIVPPVVGASEFLKHYDKLTKTHSSAMRALRMEHLKRVRIQAIDESAFNKAIRHLEDIATQPKFMKEYVDLQPLKPSTGFLEENESQLFLVPLSGYESPLHIDVRRDKGTVTCYFSYKSVKPGPKIYDFTFKARWFRIHSKFSFFKETKAYLCVVPDTDTNVTVAVSFGPQRAYNDDEDKLLVPRVSVVYTFDESEEDIDTSLIGQGRILFDSRPVRKERRQETEVLSQSVDFISVNKTVKMRSRGGIRHKNQQRQLLAKQRRLRLETESQHKAISLIDRKALRTTAALQAQFITSVLARKVTFEKLWITLIVFANHSFMMHTKFLAYKIAELRIIKRSVACQRFQKMYRAKFAPEFGVYTRMVALARNHLRLALKQSQYYLPVVIYHKLFLCLQESLSHSFISLSILRTYAHVLTIQRTWRTKKRLEQYYFRHIYNLWDRIVDEEEDRMKKGKGKDRGGRRFIHVNESPKMECVLEVLLKTKEKHRLFHKGAARRVAPLVSFLPKHAEMRKVVLRKAREARRASKLIIP